jgi:hypothetical protein
MPRICCNKYSHQGTGGAAPLLIESDATTIAISCLNRVTARVPAAIQLFAS